MSKNTFKRAHESFAITIKAPSEAIFPLACPVEEEKWIWEASDYTMIYSESGTNEKNCIFSEEMSAPHLMGPGDAGSTCWVTTRYDKDNFVIHWVHVRRSTIGIYELSLREKNAHETELMLDMTLTAIKEEANARFDENMRERMRMMMEYIGRSLKHYCETGTRLASVR